MPRWQKLLRHDALIHRYKEAVRNALAFGYPGGRAGRALAERSSTDRAPAGMEPLEPRLLLSGTVTGTVFYDLDADGVQDGGEPAYENATIYVDENDDGVKQAGETDSTTTNSSGVYSLTVPTSPPDQIIQIVVPTDWSVSLPGSGGYVEQIASGTYSGRDFGLSTSATISTANTTVDEAASFTLNLSAPGLSTPSWDIDWGDGSTSSDVTGSSTTHTYADGDNGYTITATATDGTNSNIVIASNQLNMTVEDVAPHSGILYRSNSAAAFGQYVEGYSADYTAAFQHPGQEDITGISYDWGDGTSPTVFTQNDLDTKVTVGAFTFVNLGSYTYYDSGTFTPKITITTDDSGPVELTLPAVTIGNVDANISIVDYTASVNAGEVFELDLQASFPANVQDTVEAWEVKWGDGDQESVTVSSLTRSFAHIYDDPGTYQIEIRALDGDGSWTNYAETIIGDLNNDQFVGIDDLNIVLTHWNQTVTPGDLSMGDPSGDGFVGVDDLNLILTNWNKQSSGLEVTVGESSGPSVIEVTTRADEDSTLGYMSLREAIRLANSHDGHDTITFASGVAGTITMSEGQFLITDDLDIIGLGADELTIDGDGGSRVFKIDSGIEALIEGLTLTGGLSEGTSLGGGGIFSEGDLTLHAVYLHDNHTGGIGGYGLSGGGYGSGIHQSGGSLYVVNSTIANNSGAIVGGGIYVDDSEAVNVINSTISGNTAQGIGGGIGVLSASEHVSVALLNSTITDNSTGIVVGEYQIGIGGGVALSDDTATIIHNTIIADNYNGVDPDTGDISLGPEAVISSNSSNNLIGYEPTTGNGIDDGVNGNIVGGEGANPAVDPLLSTLGDNGGPTPTHSLLTNSPALDAGSNSRAVDASQTPLTTDQRGPGFGRIAAYTGGASIVDIGAVEMQSGNLYVSGDSSVEVDETYTLDVEIVDPEGRSGTVHIDWGDGSTESEITLTDGVIGIV